MAKKNTQMVAPTEPMEDDDSTAEVANALEIFTASAGKVAIPKGAAEIIYEPSHTVPRGGAIQGTFVATRIDSVIKDRRTGEVGEFECYLLKDANGSGKDIWIRGGWDLRSKMKRVPQGARVTVERDRDNKQHPTNRAWSIGQFRVYVG